MNTASSNNTPWVYFYPLRMSYKDEEFIEFFVTFDEPNLFVEPYDSLGIKMTATVFYLIALLGAFIQYSCIIYEVNGYAASFRTAINQLVSAAYFMFATHSSVVIGFDLFRVWYGPLPAELCWVCLLFKGAIGNFGPFIMLGITILKFVYICIWRRYRQIDDDFIATSIVLTSVCLATCMQLTKNLAPGKPTYYTVFCTGEYKSSFDHLPKKIPTELGSLIPISLCQILTPIIQWQRHKLNDIEKRFGVKNQKTPQLESMTLYFIMNIVIVAAVIDIGLLNSSAPYQWNEYPNTMYLFYTQFITGLQAGLIPAIIILKKLKLKFIHEIFFDHQEKLEFGVGRAPIQVATIIPGLGHQMQSYDMK